MTQALYKSRVVINGRQVYVAESNLSQADANREARDEAKKLSYKNSKTWVFVQVLNKMIADWIPDSSYLANI